MSRSLREYDHRPTNSLLGDSGLIIPMLAIMTDKALGFARFLGLVGVATLLEVRWLLLVVPSDNKSLFVDGFVALVAIDTSKSYISAIGTAHVTWLVGKGRQEARASSG